MSFNRIERISQEIKRELGQIISTLKDPRIPNMTSVTAVDVSRDLSFATVYISVFDDKNKNAHSDVLKGLNSAKAFIRREIAKRIQLRSTPEFTFVLDDSIKHSARIFDLLSEIKKDD